MEKIIYVALILCIMTACNSTGSNDNEPIILDNSLYEAAPHDDLEFLNAKIMDDDLMLKVRYAGGCGNVEWQLIGTEDVFETDPLTRDIRLSLKDNNNCGDTKITTVSFNLIPSRTEETHRILLNLKGWDKRLDYRY